MPITLSNELPATTPQPLDNGVVLRWVAEGVLRVDPPLPGKRHLLLSAGVHGNETAPVELLDRWLRRIVAGEIVPRHSLMLMLGNPAALRAGTRYVEQDMNRLFNGAHLQSPGLEGRRAARLERLASAFFEGATAGLHYDLHTAIRRSRFEKFALYLWQPDRSLPDAEYLRLAVAGMQAVLSHERPGHTFSAFTFRIPDVESFTLELGKARPFGANTGLDTAAFEQAITALSEAREMATHPDLALPPRMPAASSLIKLSDAFRFHLDDEVENFKPLAPGALIAVDGSRRWYVEHDRAYLLFPNPDVAIGQRAGLIVVHEEGIAPECGAERNAIN